jgi:CRP/FNR family transcriptional regulator, cyclic AMP receptor protein
VRLFSHDTKVQALGRAPLFEGLSRKELGELAKKTDDMDAKPGKVLCRQGDVGHEFFVIVEGEVEVTKDGKSLGTRGAGDFIGEIALLVNTPRTATVTAKTPLRFFVLTRQGFRKLIDDHPSVAHKVLHVLGQRVMSLSGEAVN